MLVSVIIRTKDEAPRLRLCLAALSRQTVPLVAPGTTVPKEPTAAEIIVVNDGSSDGTAALLADETDRLPLRVLHHGTCQGRSAASNAGSRVAGGDVLLFLDGDILCRSRLVELHAARHDGSPLLGRGETYHLRCTRWLHDPETGTPMPGQEEAVRRLGPELQRSLVTRAQVLDRFDEIEQRAQPGIYPGAGPRQLYELEMDALQNHPELTVHWMAASGHNLSVRRHDFARVGGFDEGIDINEHRELAFRLGAAGVRMTAVAGARSFHLTHRVGWRDPALERDWERRFYQAHPCLAVKLMTIFWRSLAGDKAIPENAQIRSLVELDAIVRGRSTVDYDALRRSHPLLGPLDLPIQT